MECHLSSFRKAWGLWIQKITGVIVIVALASRRGAEGVRTGGQRKAVLASKTTSICSDSETMFIL